MKADLIDRRLLSELVDAHGNVHWEDIAKIPNEQSEVIRCKDCKHKNVYRFPPKYDERDYCEKQGKVVDVADFCSWAERREE